MDETLPQFVILRHDVGAAFDRTDQTHFDWMFESDETLVTWSTAPIEITRSDLDVVAEQIADHRLAYLEIEGDIGDDRGTVTRVARGEFDPIRWDKDRLHAELTWSDSETNKHHRKLRIERVDRGPLRDGAAGSWRLRLVG